MRGGISIKQLTWLPGTDGATSLSETICKSEQRPQRLAERSSRTFTTLCLFLFFSSKTVALHLMASLAGRGGPRSDSDYEQIALRHPDAASPNTAAFTPHAASNLPPQSQTHHDPSVSMTRPADSMSVHSDTPLTPRQAAGYPPMPQSQRPPLMTPGDSRDSDSPAASKAHGHSRPYGGDTTRPNSSWDLLSGYRKFEHEYSEFDTRYATQPHLRFADGDVSKNKVCLVWTETTERGH